MLIITVKNRFIHLHGFFLKYIVLNYMTSILWNKNKNKDLKHRHILDWPPDTLLTLTQTPISTVSHTISIDRCGTLSFFCTLDPHLFLLHYRYPNDEKEGNMCSLQSFNFGQTKGYAFHNTNHYNEFLIYSQALKIE